MGTELQRTTGNRQAYLDILRVGATLAVMLLHVAARNWYDADIYSAHWNALNFYESIVHWCVPVLNRYIV